MATLGFVDFGYEKLGPGKEEGGDEDSKVNCVSFGE